MDEESSFPLKQQEPIIQEPEVDRSTSFFIASRNRTRSNRIMDKTNNYGCNGKLTAEQLQERAELHARRVAEGFPTHEKIALHWKDKYGIAMHLQSEKQWSLQEDNRKWILSTMERMIEEGKIKKVEIQKTEVSNAITKKVQSDLELARQIKTKINGILGSFDGNKKSFELVGMTKEKYDDLSDEEKGKIDKKIDRETAYNDNLVENAHKLGLIYEKISAGLMEAIKFADKFTKERTLINQRINMEADELSQKRILESKRLKGNAIPVDFEILTGDLSESRKAAGIE